MAIYINGKTMSMTSGVPVVVEGLTEVNAGTPSDIKGLVKGNGSDLQVAIPGVDYQTPLKPNTDYQTPLEPNVDYQTPLTPNVDYQTPLVSGTDYQAPLTPNVDYQTPLTLGVDYLTPPKIVTSLPPQYTPLESNTIYNITEEVGDYVFTHPDDGGWAHGFFKSSGHNYSNFYTGAKFIGGEPNIEAGKTYEFDVYKSIWAVQEVVVKLD